MNLTGSKEGTSCHSGNKCQPHIISVSNLFAHGAYDRALHARQAACLGPGSEHMNIIGHAFKVSNGACKYKLPGALPCGLL